jgi:aminomethyltransferase
MTSTLRRTPLHARHVELGARMVEFGGWDMPVFYTGINDEHRAVRARAGIFDVSHMGQLELTGAGAKDYLQTQLSNDLDRIGDGQAQYTLLTNDRGGIVDDLIAYRLASDRWLLVVNAANVEADRRHLARDVPADVELVDRSPEYGMLALQGPSTFEVLAGVWGRGSPSLEDLQPFHAVQAQVGPVRCLVARTGYTGEPGVELLCAAEDTERLFDTLLLQRQHGVVPCGLGARDTLRLEVCYPLHGSDISPKTNAIEAGLGWVCALDKEFRGVEALRRTKASGPKRRLVAFRMLERAIPRAGLTLFHDDAEVGTVTSGTLSPSLDEGIGMGYVEADIAIVGTELVLDVRGRRRAAEIAKKPLYQPSAKKES